MDGDADISSVAAMLAEPARARILMALADGRALPASVLAAEAGVAPSTASGHLSKLLARGLLSAGDGTFGLERAREDRLSAPGRDLERAREDRLSAPGRDLDYRLTDDGEAALRAFGIDAAQLTGRRPAVRYCVDWSEQRHHLGGALGAALAARLLELHWLRRADAGRALHVTDAGRRGLPATFGVVLEEVERGAPASGRGTPVRAAARPPALRSARR